MTPEYTSMANSPLMWLACTPGVLIVLWMAWLYFRKSCKVAGQIGLSGKQVSAASRSALITSIGPCFVMLTAMLSLMLYVGAPLAWLRVDFIGGLNYEMSGAIFAAEGMGIEFGSAEMDASYLAAAAIVMGGGCLGWVVFVALFADKMDKVNRVLAGGNAKLIPIIGTGAIIGTYSSLTWDRVLPVDTQLISVVTAAALMWALTGLNRKMSIQWLKEWSLSISMIGGAVAATVAAHFGIFAA